MCRCRTSRTALQVSSAAALQTNLERQLSKDEEVEGDPQRPHVGLPPPVALARTHLGGCSRRAGSAVQGQGVGGGGQATAARPDGCCQGMRGRRAGAPSCPPAKPGLPSLLSPCAPRYAGVPSVRLKVSLRSKNWDCPKSPILTTPLPLSITFSGFMSPCTCRQKQGGRGWQGRATCWVGDVEASRGCAGGCSSSFSPPSHSVLRAPSKPPPAWPHSPPTTWFSCR